MMLVMYHYVSLNVSVLSTEIRLHYVSFSVAALNAIQEVYICRICVYLIHSHLA